MANRRKHRRFIKRCNVEFALDGVLHAGISSNFSLRGMFVRTTYPQAPDSVIEVKLYLLGARPRHCESGSKGPGRRLPVK